MTEPEFNIRFVTPIIDLLMKAYDNLVFKTDEQKLITTKEYENSALEESSVCLPVSTLMELLES
ncbi:unnamed protein product [Rhizopus stolonifer]